MKNKEPKSKQKHFHVCGVTCEPDKPECNNYCNMKTVGGVKFKGPMPDSPAEITQSSPVETPVRSAVEELSEKEFCRMYTQYHSEEINNIRQLVCASFSGEELMEFVQHCLKSRPSVVGESRIKELEATIDNLRNQIEYAAEATRKYVREKEEQRFTIEDMRECWIDSVKNIMHGMPDIVAAEGFDEWIKTRK